MPTNIQLQEQIDALRNKLRCCCNILETTDGPPTADGRTIGQQMYDPATNTHYIWDGDSWESFEGADHTHLMVDITDLTVILSGTYTPTVTAGNNMDSAANDGDAQYMRVGNVVTVSGRLTADATDTLVAADLTISVPIPSLLGLAEEAGGTAVAGGIVGESAAIEGGGGADVVVMRWIPVDTGDNAWSYHFTYLITS